MNHIHETSQKKETLRRAKTNIGWLQLFFLFLISSFFRNIAVVFSLNQWKYDKSVKQKYIFDHDMTISLYLPLEILYSW